MAGDNVLKLTSPIKHGEEELLEIPYRAPTMRDIRKLGLPLNVETRDVNMEAAAKYLEVLAGLPPSVVNQLNAADSIAWIVELAPFFGGSQA